MSELVSELHAARLSNDDYNWESAIAHLFAIKGALEPLFDLVRNIQRELEAEWRPLR